MAEEKKTPSMIDLTTMAEESLIAHNDNSEKIQENKEKIDPLYQWSSFFATPIGKVLGGMIISLATLLITWLSGKLDPAPIPVPVPGEIKVVIPEPKQDGPKKEAVVVYTKRIIYAVFKDTDPSILKNLPPGAVQEYPDGTKWSFNGELIPLPVMVTKDLAGKDLEVRKIP